MSGKCDIYSCGMELDVSTEFDTMLPDPQPLDCKLVCEGDIIDGNLKLLNAGEGIASFNNVTKTGLWRNYKAVFEGRMTELIRFPHLFTYKCPKEEIRDAIIYERGLALKERAHQLREIKDKNEADKIEVKLLRLATHHSISSQATERNSL